MDWKTLMARITRNIAWLHPFIKAASDLVPLDRVRMFYGYKVPLNNRSLADASTTKHSDGTFTICLEYLGRVQVKSGKTTFKYVSYSNQFLAEFLNSLAHEMAHLKCWEHTVKHYKLQLKIERRFVSVLKKLKVKNTWARTILPIR